MWITLIPKVALCLLLLAATGHSQSDHIVKGDPFAICLSKDTNNIASGSRISCDAGSVPAYFQSMKRKGNENIEVQFQSNPDKGSHSYKLRFSCPAASTATTTSTSTSTSTVTSTSTEKMMKITTKSDCTMTPGPSPTPDNNSLCTTGKAACVNTREDFSSAIGCDEGYRPKGCACYDSQNIKTHHPRCNGVGEVVCVGCN